MKKRVGIITHYGNISLNYGGALQATAMQELLRMCDCVPITINHSYLGRTPKEQLQNLLKQRNGFIKTWFAFKKWYKKYIVFSTKCIYDSDIIEYAKNNCDILLCGSDNIWGTSMPRFFWDYEELDDLPHIAYAASLIGSGITYDLSRVINKYVSISVRDFSLVKFLEKYNTPIETVLDPTLTVPYEFWNNKAARQLIKDKYILCYTLSEIEYHKITIKTIKSKYNADRIVYINMDCADKTIPNTESAYSVLNEETYSDYDGTAYPKTVGPEEFLSLIKYSTAVFTDSFHGTCMSIVFQKDFYVTSRHNLNRKEDDHRASGLLSRLGLEDRYITYNDEVEKLEPINWTLVNKQLNEEKNHSIKFLEKALKSCDAY